MAPESAACFCQARSECRARDSSFAFHKGHRGALARASQAGGRLCARNGVSRLRGSGAVCHQRHDALCGGALLPQRDGGSRVPGRLRVPTRFSSAPRVLGAWSVVCGGLFEHRHAVPGGLLLPDPGTARALSSGLFLSSRFVATFGVRFDCAVPRWKRLPAVVVAVVHAPCSSPPGALVCCLRSALVEAGAAALASCLGGALPATDATLD